MILKQFGLLYEVINKLLTATIEPGTTGFLKFSTSKLIQSLINKSLFITN